MAFGVQQPLDYSKDISTLDIAQLSGQVQTALQQRFDVNTAKMEEMIQQISSVPLLQDASKKYLYDRVQGALDLVNADLKATQGRGLLSSSTTSRLGKYVQSSIDDTVKKHIQYSQSIINFENSVSELKKKDPSTYNQNNYDFAKYQAGYNEYLTGDVNSNLGSLQYTPYTDVMSNAIKKAKEYKSLKGDSKVEIRDAVTGLNRVTTVSGLTEEEIVNNIPGFLTQAEEVQIAIDGWAQVRNLPDQGKGEYTNYLNRKIEINNGKLAQLKAMNSSNSTPEDLERAKSLIANLENSNSSFTEQMSKVGQKRPEEIGYALHKQNIVNTMRDLFQGSTSVEYKVDDHWKTLRQFENEDRKFELDRLKYELSAKKEKRESGESEAGLNGVSTEPIFGQTVQDLSGEYVLEEAKKMILEDELFIENQVLSEFYNLNSQEGKDAFIGKMQEQGYTYNPSTDDFITTDKNAPSKTAALQSSYLLLRSLDYGDPRTEVIIAEKELEVQRKMSAIQSAKSTAESNKGFWRGVKEGALDTVNKASKALSLGLIDHTNSVGDTKQSMSNEAIGNVLKSNESLQRVFNKYEAVVTGDKMQNVISMISPNTTLGGEFNKKGANVSVKYDASTNTFEVKQNKGMTGSGDKRKQEFVTATIANDENSSTANYLKSFINISTATNSIDARDYQSNTPIKSYKPPQMANINKEPLHKKILVDIQSFAQEDPSLALGLARFASKEASVDELTNSLLLQGYSKQEAYNISNNIVNKVISNEITTDLLPNKYGWFKRILVNGEPSITQEAGSGLELSRRESFATKITPAQSTLMSINNILQNQSLGREELERKYPKIIR